MYVAFRRQRPQDLLLQVTRRMIWTTREALVSVDKRISAGSEKLPKDVFHHVSLQTSTYGYASMEISEISICCCAFVHPGISL